MKPLGYLALILALTVKLCSSLVFKRVGNYQQSASGIRQAMQGAVDKAVESEEDNVGYGVGYQGNYVAAIRLPAAGQERTNCANFLHEQLLQECLDPDNPVQYTTCKIVDYDDCRVVITRRGSLSEDGVLSVLDSSNTYYNDAGVRITVGDYGVAAEDARIQEIRGHIMALVINAIENGSGSFQAQQIKVTLFANRNIEREARIACLQEINPLVYSECVDGAVWREKCGIRRANQCGISYIVH